MGKCRVRDRHRHREAAGKLRRIARMALETQNFISIIHHGRQICALCYGKYHRNQPCRIGSPAFLLGGRGFAADGAILGDDDEDTGGFTRCAVESHGLATTWRQSISRLAGDCGCCTGSHRTCGGWQSIMKNIALLALFMLVGAGLGAQAGAADPRSTVLVEGAKKEAKMVFYTSVETEFARALTSAFEAKYPSIKTDIFRSTHENIFSRLNVERQTGTFTADVISVGEFETFHLQRRGFIAAYKTPFAATYPDGFKDPDGYWTDLYDNLIVTAYNTSRVKRDEIPKRYEDLLHPRWKGRMVLDQNEDRWFANMLYLMGEKKGLEFMQALAKQNVAIRGGRSMVTQLLGAGEYDLQIVAYLDRPYLMKKQGAPVDWVGLEPAIVALHPISVVEKAPHPNAAKLFIDFALSDEGQRIFVQRGRESAKPGLKPEGYPVNLRVAPSRVQLAEKLADYTRQYEALFVRGR